MYLGIIFVNNQPDAQFFSMYVYFYSLHVSDSNVSIIRRTDTIDTRNSPGDGYMAVRDMWIIEINIHKKELCVNLVIYKD